MDGVITYISDNIAEEWKKLGLELDLSWAKIKQIEHNNPRDIQNAIIDMLQTWRIQSEKTKKPQQSLEDLKIALEKCGLKNVAEELDDVFKTKDTKKEESLHSPVVLEELLTILQNELKNKYQCELSKVNYAQGHKEPRNFDVDSSLYIPVQFIVVSTDDKQQNLNRQYSNSTTYAHEEGLNLGAYMQMSDTGVEAEDLLKNTLSTKDIAKLLTKEYNSKKYTILIEADAGVGKTTLLHRLGLEWAKGSCEVLKKFSLVFLIHLRHIKHDKVEDIILDILPEDLEFEPDEKKALRKFLQRSSDQILYLIDGLDEVKIPDENELLKKIRGPGNHVICTSRPVLQCDKKGSPYGMQKRLHIKLLGFSDNSMYSYIKEYFKRDVDQGKYKARTILDECRKHMFCKAIMRAPLYTDLICFLWKKHNDNLPDSATQLFNKFLKEKLVVYWSDRYSGDSGDIVFRKNPLEKTMPKQIRHLLYHVAQLAFQTLVEGKVVFSLEDAEECHLDEEDITALGVFTIENPKSSGLQFCHKLFHEYFAGLWLIKCHSEVKEHLRSDFLRILLRKDYLHHAFLFAAGMCKDTYTCIESTLQDRSKKQHKLKYAQHTNSDIKLYLNVFHLELTFEHVENPTRKHGQSILIHCGSAHSLAAAFALMKSDSGYITLIGGGHTDLEQILCILYECKRVSDVSSIHFHDSTDAVMQELHRMAGTNVRKIGFYNCHVVVDVACLCNLFPKLSHVVYKSQPCDVSKVNQSSENDKNMTVIVSHQSAEKEATKILPLTDTDTLVVDIRAIGVHPNEILCGCKVHRLMVQDIEILKSLNRAVIQGLRSVTLFDTEKCLYCKELCQLCPSLSLVHVYKCSIVQNKELNSEPLAKMKSVRLLVRQLQSRSCTQMVLQNESQDTLSVVVEDDHFSNDSLNSVEFLRDMPLDIVSKISGPDFLCHPSQKQDITKASVDVDFGLQDDSDFASSKNGPNVTIPHQMGTVKPSSKSGLQRRYSLGSGYERVPLDSLEVKQKLKQKTNSLPTFTNMSIYGSNDPSRVILTSQNHFGTEGASNNPESSLSYGCDVTCDHKIKIKDFLELYSCFSHIILGPLLATTKLCPFMISCLENTSMCEHKWTLEGQLVEQLPDPLKKTMDDFFFVGSRWLPWEFFNFMIRIKLDPRFKITKQERNDVPTLIAVIRMTKIKI